MVHEETEGGGGDLDGADVDCSPSGGGAQGTWRGSFWATVARPWRKAHSSSSSSSSYSSSSSSSSAFPSSWSPFPSALPSPFTLSGGEVWEAACFVYGWQLAGAVHLLGHFAMASLLLGVGKAQVRLPWQRFVPLLG